MVAVDSLTSTARFCSRLADAWRPRPRLNTPDWCARNVRLPGDFGTPGRYDLDDFPYWRGPLAAMDDPDVHEIVLMAATQVGKTEALKAMLASQSDIDPCPMMLVGPDRDYIAEMRDKIYAAAEINPVLQDRIPPKSARNMRWLDFGFSYCYLAWVGNTQRISGKAAKIIFCSEVDRYRQTAREGAIHKLVSERVKSFARYKIIWESTPMDETSAIAALYEQSNRCRYLCPCPHCNHFQELRFWPHRDGRYRGAGGIAGLQDDKGDWLTPDQALESAHYVCERGCRIEDSHKPGMVSAGIWCPDGQTVDKRGKLKGTPLRPSRVSGFQLGSIVARVIGFGRMASEYLACRDSEKGLRNFINNWLGLKYTVRSKVPKWRTLGQRQAGGYERGKIPPAALFVTAAADVQDDRCYWIVRAWGEGATSWLIDWGVCLQHHNERGETLRNSDLQQLADLVVHRRFPLLAANPLGALSLPVRLLCIDCNFQTRRVWDFVRQFPGDQVRAVAGDHQMKSDFYQMTVVEKSARDGKAYPGGLKRWGINTAMYKQDLQARWSVPLDTAGAWLLPHRAVEDAETYLRQIVNETEDVARNKLGRPVTIWRVIDQRTGNHYWDCEVYARAAADMIVGGDFSDLVRKSLDARKAAGAGRGSRRTEQDEDFSAR